MKKKEEKVLSNDYYIEMYFMLYHIVPCIMLQLPADVGVYKTVEALF